MDPFSGPSKVGRPYTECRRGADRVPALPPLRSLGANHFQLGFRGDGIAHAEDLSAGTDFMHG